jgi:hypothetical protein
MDQSIQMSLENGGAKRSPRLFISHATIYIDTNQNCVVVTTHGLASMSNSEIRENHAKQEMVRAIE